MAEMSRGGKVNNVKNLNILGFLIDRQINVKGNSSKLFTKNLWDTAKDLYKKDLTAHFGCVNAIEFSNDGSLLFSGGDDQRVLMWNVNSAMMYYTRKMGENTKPRVMKANHFSNIFCLAIDDDNKRILSGSNDDQVIVHDYISGEPVDYFVHDSPVFSLSLHPLNGNIFASAANNGRISIYDIRRSNADPLCLARFRTPFHGVMFNPFEPSLVATANSKVGIHIWDLRRPKEVLYECSDEQSMAVRWNQTGSILLALRNLLPPVLYNPRNPKKKLEFDAPGYYNACTMKSCSFAGDNDEYVLSGSDDFNLYMWKVPEPWPLCRWVTEPHLTLIGHRSIVNQVRYDHNKQLIASSGVEKIIKIWSPMKMPYSEGNRDRLYRKGSRFLCASKSCTRSPGILNHDYSQESIDEDLKMIHFFDSLLHNELSTRTQSQVYCIDGRIFPNSRRRNNSKAYEQLINRKKKYLMRLMNRRCNDPYQVCALSEVPLSREEYIENCNIPSDTDSVSSSPTDQNDEKNRSGSCGTNQEATENGHESPLSDSEVSVSPTPSEMSRSSSSLSSISSYAPSDTEESFKTPSMSSCCSTSGHSSPANSEESSSSSELNVEEMSETDSDESSDILSDPFSCDGSPEYDFDLSQESSTCESDDSENAQEQPNEANGSNGPNRPNPPNGPNRPNPPNGPNRPNPPNGPNRPNPPNGPNRPNPPNGPNRPNPPNGPIRRNRSNPPNGPNRPNPPNGPNRPNPPNGPNRPNPPNGPNRPNPPNGPNRPNPPNGPNRPNPPNGPNRRNRSNPPNGPNRPNPPNGPNRPNPPNGPNHPNPPNGPNRPNPPNGPNRPNPPNGPNRPNPPNGPNHPNPPNGPNRPNRQNRPFVPIGPNGPNGPNRPIRPFVPSRPNGLNRPIRPYVPSSLNGLNRPIRPYAPNGPNGPNRPIRPIGPIGPTGSSGPNCSIRPISPIDPTGSNDPNRPIRPIGPIGPTGSSGPNCSIRPISPIDPTSPNNPNRPIRPIGPNLPIRFIGPIGPTGSSGPNRPIRPIGPIDPTSPNDPNNPLRPIGPIGPTGFGGPNLPIRFIGPTGSNCSNIFNDSGVNVSESSDTDDETPSFTLKRKRITQRNRSYLNVKKRRNDDDEDEDGNEDDNEDEDEDDNEDEDEDDNEDEDEHDNEVEDNDYDDDDDHSTTSTIYESGTESDPESDTGDEANISTGNIRIINCIGNNGDYNNSHITTSESD